MCSLLFVCISSKDAKCYPIRINDVWLNSLLNMYFTCNRHAMKLYLTKMFFVSVPLIIIVNCVPRVSLDGALSHEVCVFNLPTLPKVWPFMVQCLFMHCSTHGWPLRKRCAQRLCKGLPTTKNILSCTLCDIVSCLYFFFLSNKQFSSSSSSSSSRRAAYMRTAAAP